VADVGLDELHSRSGDKSAVAFPQKFARVSGMSASGDKSFSGQALA